MNEIGPLPIVTVSSRLARWLTLQYNQRKQEQGESVWEAPSILSLNAWLKTLWEESWPEQFILSDLQSKQLWESVIKRSRYGGDISLLNLKSAANQAANAYQLIHEYELDAGNASFLDKEETKEFLEWKRAYETRLESLNALDPASLAGAVLRKMERREIPTPDHLTLAGFMETTPQHERMIRVLESNNTQVTLAPPLSGDALSSTRTTAWKDKKEEVVQCARWIRKTHRPGKTIGVVVPELESYRSLIFREFRMELSPASVLPTKDMEPPFNISLGAPLAEEPMIWTALQLICAGHSKIPLATLSILIKSPFLEMGRTHFLESIRLEKLWASKRVPFIYLEDIKESSIAPLLGEWNRFILLADTLLPSQWTSVIFDFLKQQGWPSQLESSFQSRRDFQAYEAWKECLENFSTLDDVSGSLTREQAVHLLGQLVTEKLFQIKTREQPIQIIGLLESSGMQFDHVWVMGCHADCLPSPPAPNPFLPIPIQKQKGIPHSDAGRERAYAMQSIARLASAAPDVIFSYPENDGIHECLISPLLVTIPSAGEQFSISHSSALAGKIQNTLLLDEWQEANTLPWTLKEKELYASQLFPGGTSSIKNQADCPFKAFANHRLKLYSFEILENDYENLERGNLTHKTLELFWKEVKTQQNLKRLQADNLLESAVIRNVRSAQSYYRKIFVRQSLFENIERQRLTQLMMEWMEKELLRTDDFTVLHEELSKELTLAGLQLKLKIDRVDKTVNEQIILIDYKTSKNESTSQKRWFEERLSEPQLPLYSLAMKCDAVAIGIVSKGETSWASTSSPQVFLGSKKYQQEELESWEGILSHWRNGCEQLAQELVDGLLIAQPLRKHNTCRICPHETLCRIKERSNWMSDDEDES
ncbi:MAG: hypothetical protein G3M78_09890 [Candidatus Nitrohelix vancouverensis]|uniref:PD-(D/E)XK endonuclease-like domain-containing protein n=1 Tax=Candidatus Nitrohelix vancouverensis TaxID=2705534 RepID=A0A7T0G3W1_9BACT|nr:MAG: hypothetical protein G3M78_09890 [Candidatus Nitrohelix vancouverensis]